MEQISFNLLDFLQCSTIPATVRSRLNYCNSCLISHSIQCSHFQHTHFRIHPESNSALPIFGIPFRNLFCPCGFHGAPLCATYVTTVVISECSSCKVNPLCSSVFGKIAHSEVGWCVVRPMDFFVAFGAPKLVPP